MAKSKQKKSRNSTINRLVVEGRIYVRRSLQREGYKITNEESNITLAEKYLQHFQKDHDPLGKKTARLVLATVALEYSENRKPEDAPYTNLHEWWDKRLSAFSVKVKKMPRIKRKPEDRKKEGLKFYESWEWKKLRYKILQKYGPVCMLCGDSKNDGVRIVVDHIKPRTIFPELELEESNLQVLCNSCNMGKSNDDYTDFRGDAP